MYLEEANLYLILFPVSPHTNLCKNNDSFFNILKLCRTYTAHLPVCYPTLNRNMNLLNTLTTEYYQGGIRGKSAGATKWFAKKMQDYIVSPEKIMSENRERASPSVLIGNMYFFFYDAKYKETLPYWDRFPLVIPIDFYSESFLGLNLHYLDYKSRAILLDKLSEVQQTPNMTQLQDSN